MTCSPPVKIKKRRISVALTSNEKVLTGKHPVPEEITYKSG